VRAGGWLALLCAGTLAGCGSAGGIAGGIAGVATGAATANPAVGYAVAVGVEAGTNATVKYVTRRLHRGEQDAISAAAGKAPPGSAVDWEVEHSLPFGYGDAKGKVEVVREIDSPLARCREVALTLEGETQTFLGMICRQESGWKWANAEPATARWGALQ
jgi:hypothetical protein